MIYAGMIAASENMNASPEDVEGIDHARWIPNRKGTEMVWGQKQFLEDNEGRPVCTTCKKSSVGGKWNP